MKSAKTILLIGAILILEIWFLAACVFAEEGVNKGAGFRAVNIKDPFFPLYPKKEREKTTMGSTKSVKREEGELKPPELTIQGLVWGKINPQAIVNDTVVSIGDTLQDAKILDISKEGIKVLFKGVIFLIKPQTAEGKNSVALKGK